jgi:MoaA/NifB/PqqE/SkfB family radical SAM enzyme
LEIKDVLWIGKDRLPELEKTIVELKRIKRDRGVVLNTNRHLEMIEDYIKNPDTARLNDVCTYPLTALFIYPNGDVRTCLEKIGNIRNQPLTSIWKSSNVTKENLYCQKICINPCFHLHDQLINFFYEDVVSPFLGKLKNRR